MEQQWAYQDFLTSHTLSSKMKKKCTTKKSHQGWTQKKDIFQTHKEQKRKLYTPMIRQHTHIALTNQKSSAVYFKDVKTEETFSSQDQKLVETNNLWRQLSSDKKSPQRKCASATITKPVELMIGTTMNSSRLLN